MERVKHVIYSSSQVLSYMDYIILLSPYKETHASHLLNLLQVLTYRKWKLVLDKWQWGEQRLDFIGFLVFLIQDG